MASIYKEIPIEAPAETVWAAIRDVGAAHRLFAGVLTDCRLDGDSRTVTFANGFVVRELIVAIDEPRRRFCYAAVGGRSTHHHASLQVFEDGTGRSKVTWITDLLPDEVAPGVEGLMEQGAQAMVRSLTASRYPGETWFCSAVS
jgi:carbon monoxide dehydrogenase subunit G